jgi:adenylate cyclase
MADLNAPARKPAPSVDPSQQKGDPMVPNRVLVVEDDAGVRGLLQTILEDEGFEIVLAADGEEGLRLARTVDPAVVLIDVMMPGLGGPEVIRRLRRPDGTLPFAVLVLTGAVENVEPLRYELGSDSILEKPFDIIKLADRVKELASSVEHGSSR